MIRFIQFVNCISIVILFQLSALSVAGCEPLKMGTEVAAAAGITGSPAVRFNRFNNLVRDGKISRASAAESFSILLKDVKDDYYARGGLDSTKNSWVFPLSGYNERSITGGKNKGYSASGYDYFSGNRHGGHPSFDIFIRDRNQDSLDDRSLHPVTVLSLGAGIVVALEAEWEQGSKLRGGRYLWVYDPGNSLLVYYAHNGALSVGLGDIVRPGDRLATVGRSGLNAARRRSPTHLHLTVLEIRNNRPVPLNIYADLAAAGRIALQ